jgi:hypothetical protein
VPSAQPSAQGCNFALPAGSKDAVVIVNLAAGSYTVLINGVGATTGIALLEISELP